MIDLNSILILFILIQTKHVLVDWIWQPSYEFLNKGTYGHWGGIRHSMKNAIGTGICFGFFFPWFAVLWVIAADFIIHYHIDWAKVNFNKKMKWGPTTHHEFWWLTGIDQYLHQLTYLYLIISVIRMLETIPG